MISDVHFPPTDGSVPWKPFHRSPVAGLVWRTFAAGRSCGWSSGRIVHPAPEAEDAPLQPEFRRWQGGFEVPDWICGLMDRLDSLVPPAEDLMAVLDPDSLTLVTEPAAFRMPSDPSAAEAGACVAAARILLSLRDELVVPVFVEPDEAFRRIGAASCMALMLGGESAFLWAAETLSDPATYALNPVPEDVPLVIEDEEG